MTETAPALPARSSGTALTRFNALRHGVLSRYTLLPWEEESKYHELLSALVSEHQPSGPTEEHMVEEPAGILWRKRRLRLAEAASFRRGLEDATSFIRATATAAVSNLGACPGASESTLRWRGPVLVRNGAGLACRNDRR